MTHLKTKLGLGVTTLLGIVLISVGAMDVKPKTAPQATATKGSGRLRPVLAYNVLVDDHRLGGTRLIVMHAESNALDPSGNPTVPSRDRRFIYPPPISLKAQQGELLVSVTDDGEIALPVMFDRPDSRNIIADFLIKHDLLAEKANPGQIQIATARAIRIETPPNYVPHIVFGPWENFEFTNFEDVLTTKATPGLAQKFVEDLKKGRVGLNAVIAFEGYDFEQNQAVITFEDIAETHYFKNMTGPGGPGYISRHQMANVAHEAATGKGIALTTEYDDADFKQLVTNLLICLDKKEEELKNAWTSLDSFFTREGWNPEDFRADLITRSKTDKNSEYAGKFREDLRLIASDKRKGGGFNFELFGEKIINTDNKGEDEQYRDWQRSLTREVLDKWSLKYEEEGKRIIPKKVTAYRNDVSQLRAKGTFRIGQRKKFRSEAIKTIAVNPNNALQSPAKWPFEVRQAELTKKVESLEIEVKRLSRIAAKHETLVQRLEMMGGNLVINMGNYYLGFQDDGNIVLRKRGQIGVPGPTIWATNTDHK